MLVAVLGGMAGARVTRAASASLTTQTLPVSGVADMVVDAAHGHIFLSAPSNNEILVLDYHGNIVTTITGESDPNSMVIVGSTLYVTLVSLGGVDRIDTGTLTETSPLTLHSLVQPGELVYAVGELWTATYVPGNLEPLCLARIDASTGAVTTYMSFCNGGLGIRLNPADGNMLITWNVGMSPATITTIDVSTGSPVPLVSLREETLDNVQDVAGDPAGNGFITAAGGTYAFDEFRYWDLNQNGVVYPAAAYPTAVATTSAQGGLMVGGLDSPYGNSLWVYHYDDPATLIYSGWSGAQIVPRGVAFQPDGTAVFGVGSVWNGATSVVSFGVISLAIPPRPNAPSVTGLSPAHGASAGGTSVVISGSRFFAGTSSCGVSAVHFGAVLTSAPTACTDTSVTVAAPPAFPSSVDVTVTTSEATTAPITNDVYTYDPVDVSVSSDAQYHLSDSDGSTWTDIDTSRLQVTFTASGPADVVLRGE